MCRHCGQSTTTAIKLPKVVHWPAFRPSTRDQKVWKYNLILIAEITSLNKSYTCTLVILIPCVHVTSGTDSLHDSKATTARHAMVTRSFVHSLGSRTEMTSADERHLTSKHVNRRPVRCTAERRTDTMTAARRKTIKAGARCR